VSTFTPTTRPAWPFLSPEVDFVPVGPWNTDGLIIIAPHQGNDDLSRYLEQMMAIHHPLAFVQSAENRPVICLDNKDGIRQAVRHLKEHGHKRLAFIGGGPGWQGDSRERLQAFLSSCEELGIETEQRLMAYGHFSTAGGYQAMHQILASGVPFTGVIASNDDSAVGAMQALHAANLSVPEDVAVVGFDNRFEARNQTPSLTTINQPGFELGYNSLTLMVRILKGEAVESSIVRIPAHLVIRESCGCGRETTITKALDNLNHSVVDQRFPSSPKYGVDSLTYLRLIETMSDSVFADAGQLSLDTIRIQCESIAQGFISSLTIGNPTAFDVALADVLRPIRPWDEDAHAWQNAITTLRYWWPLLVEQSMVESRSNEILTWLDRARILITECAQSQLLRYFSRQDTLTQQLSMMSADLAEMLDISQIQKVINQYLPILDIRHAQLVLFEPDQDNPVAWSVFPELSPSPALDSSTQTKDDFSTEAASVSRRFPTQEFPPPGRYAEDQGFRLALLPLIVHEKPVGFVAFDAANLTPCLAVLRQLASAMERIRLYQEAAEARRLAEEADRMKSRFLSTVSHELRTPLNLIVGLSEMELKQSATDKRRSVERIHTSAQHLSHLIRDVLDLASSDAGQLRLTCEPLDLYEALQIVVETGRQMASDKGLEWQTDIATSLPRIWGDRTRLQQVTLNLVSNAVKFTSYGSVKLSAYLDGIHTVIAVRDTGLGIPADEQAWIFNEFRQSERTTARGYGGLGLGLAICKRLVELHNGEISVTSSGREGEGSTFFIRLPILSNAEAFGNSLHTSLRQVVFILTEDPSSSQPIQEHLELAGFTVEVQAVDDTSSWFSNLLAAPPGAMVLDDQVAAKHGWELLRVLKGNPATEDIPILFYSLQQRDDAGTMLSLDYLSKPVAQPSLHKILSQQGKSKTILIADDEPGFLEIYAEMIQKHSPDHEVLKAHDGREVLALLGTTHVDLVLLDLMMPEVDGFGVLAQMREWETTREIPVVILSSKTITEADMVRLNQGVATVMSKGLYDVNEMLSHIESALSRNRTLGTESQRLVRKAMAYIHEHYAEELTREVVARHINVSEVHLARCFRQETGITPMAYLNRYRINQAKTILTTTNESITSVAMAVGFSDSNYFSRFFREKVGCSPLVYRRKHRG